MGYYSSVSKLTENGWDFWGETKRPNEIYEGYDGTFLIEGEDGLDDVWIVNPKIVAVLSSPMTFGNGIFKSEEIEFPQDLSGLFSYVGHPNTKALLEALGAEYIPGRWEGPKVGESYIAVPLARNEREGGYTEDVAIESVKELKAILVTRLA